MSTATDLRFERRPDGTALLRVDVPDRAVNVVTRELLAHLDAVLDDIAGDPSLKLLVLRSDKVSGFMAGADLQMFTAIRTPEEATALSAAGQQVFAKLEALPIPSIALIHGPCLGGGLELALACDYRLALDHPKTQLGLPEVELGIVPGWGGTQRLPRVVGIERALQVMLAGKWLNPAQALRWGLVDAVGADEGKLAAYLSLWMEKARTQGKRPRHGLPLRTWRQRILESNPLSRYLLFRGTERLLGRKVPDDMPAPWEALKAVRVGSTQGPEAGFAFERETAGRLFTTPASRNLVRLFFQREEARKLPASLPANVAEVRTVAVVGAGTMGAGIAQLAAVRGYNVIVREVSESALAAGMERIAGLFRKAVENRILAEDTARQRQAAIRATTAWDGFRDADLVVEAVLEDLSLKRKVFEELEANTRPDAVLATNTSSLLVGQVQEGRERPGRVAGLHFFNPVHKMPLVEVVRAVGTDTETVARLLQWTVAVGKTPVVVKDSPGFVVNRVVMPYLYEAFVLAHETEPFDEIDAVMRRFGMPMGPFELLDQVGIDVASHILGTLRPLFESRVGQFVLLDSLENLFSDMVSVGWLGQKAGVGFYSYRGGAKRVNARARSVFPRRRRGESSGLPPAVRKQQARERMVLVMVNEAARCLEEGLAADAATIDLAMVLGTGWAPHRGGPLRYAEDRGKKEVAEAMVGLARRLGPRFEPRPWLR